MSKINIYLKTKCESYPFQAYHISHRVKECISPLESHRKGTSMKHSPHTAQYSAEHTIAALNNAFLSF